MTLTGFLIGLGYFSAFFLAVYFISKQHEEPDTKHKNLDHH
jgi:hypothetical protein